LCVKSVKIETKTVDVLPVLELYGRYIKNTAKSAVSQGPAKMDIYEVKEPIFIINIFKTEA